MSKAKSKRETIRDAVIRRATELEMSANAIAVAAKIGDEWSVSPDHVFAYLAGRKDMTSQKLDAVLRVLGLQIK